MYNRGTSDAIKYYTGYKTPGTWNLVGGIACGILMIPLPIASSLTPPEDKNLHYPNPGLFSDINYQRGYREKAKKIKSGKVWTNYLIGCGIGTLISIIVNAS